MNTAQALAFVRKHGVVLASGIGAVPRLSEAIAGAPIKGSWWAHPRSRQIFSILQAIYDSEDVLVCRLVGGKITLVHHRLWPALVRAAGRFPQSHLAKVREEHTPSGHHVTREIPFPEWVPAAVREQARQIGEQEALMTLGKWALESGSRRRGAARKRRAT